MQRAVLVVLAMALLCLAVREGVRVVGSRGTMSTPELEPFVDVKKDHWVEERRSDDVIDRLKRLFERHSDELLFPVLPADGAIMSFVNGLSEEEVRELVTFLMSGEMTNRDRLIPVLVEHWVSLAPGEAVGFLRSYFEERGVKGAGTKAVETGVNGNVFIVASDRGPKLLLAAYEAWAKMDAVGAWKDLTSRPVSSEWEEEMKAGVFVKQYHKDLVASKLIRELVRVDPDLAFEGLVKMGERAFSDGLLNAFLGVVPADFDFQKIANEQGLLDWGVRRPIESTVIGYPEDSTLLFMSRWMETDPDAAIRWYRALPIDPAFGLEGLGDLDGASASEILREENLAGIMELWVSRDPQNSVNWIEGQVDKGKGKGFILRLRSSAMWFRHPEMPDRLEKIFEKAQR